MSGKLAIKKRGEFNYEIGPTNGGTGKGKTVMVSAKDKQEALTIGKPLWKKKYCTNVEQNERADKHGEVPKDPGEGQ